MKEGDGAQDQRPKAEQPESSSTEAGGPLLRELERQAPKGDEPPRPKEPALST